MIRTVTILIISIVIFYFGIIYITPYTGLSRSEVFGWMGVVLLAYFLERIIKRLIMYPFQKLFKEIQGNVLALGVQNMGVTLAYLCVWLAIGVSPISAFVQGYHPEKWISQPLFLWLSLMFILVTSFFSLIWVITARFKR